MSSRGSNRPDRLTSLPLEIRSLIYCFAIGNDKDFCECPGFRADFNGGLSIEDGSWAFAYVDDASTREPETPLPHQTPLWPLSSYSLAKCCSTLYDDLLWLIYDEVVRTLIVKIDEYGLPPA